MKHLRYFIACLSLIACSSSDHKVPLDPEMIMDENTNQQITPVKVTQLATSDFHHDLITNGSISSQRIADLRFTSNELVKQIYVKNGDLVAKGQKIAELDQFRLRNTLLQALDNYEKSKLDLQDVLIGQGYTLKDSLLIPEDVMKIAKIRSNYDQSLINYQNADYNLRNSVLYAPFSGVVANLFTKEHNIAASSDAFCTIIDLTQPEVVFNILENEVALIRRGTAVKISPYAAADYSVNGQITEINPTVDRNSMVRVRARLEASSQLINGMNVKVLLQRTLDKQLAIPKTALVLRTNRQVVFTLKNGKAYWNYVSTGLENSTSFVVTEGLQEGDTIIYDGNINLAHETPVVVL